MITIPDTEIVCCTKNNRYFWRATYVWYEKYLKPYNWKIIYRDVKLKQR